jgi:hypothetical protein
MSEGFTAWHQRPRCASGSSVIRRHSKLEIRMSDVKRRTSRRLPPWSMPNASVFLTSDIRHLTSGMVGLGRFERPTSRLSGVRSDQLSYRPRPRTPHRSAC